MQNKNKSGASPDQPTWDSGQRWDSGLRWPGAVPPTNTRHLAIIKTNTSRLNILEKCARGLSIVTKSTSNPLAPGNAAQLAKFATAQNALVASNAAVIAAEETLRQLVAGRNADDTKWDAELIALAGVTQAVTGGDETAILSTGFEVRLPSTPTPPLDAPINVLVRTNGTPGISKVSWELECADSFIVQMSLDAGAPTHWTDVLMTTKSSAEIPGAEPGKCAWFRVAGFNVKGIGPWSAPACRPVM